MLKEYRSNSCLSLSVVLPSGKSAHIVFTPRTGTGSIYYTSDEMIQKALESHHRFGKAFFLVQSKSTSAAAPTTTESEAETATATETPVAATKAIEVSSLDDAKDYLADKYGLSRTKIRTWSAANKYAEEVGVTFIKI